MAIEEKQPGGIFIPWEKLLEQIDGKLDKIDGKLDGKLEARVFEDFRGSYERRHEDLANRIRSLEDERNEREGIKEYKTLLMSGGALVAVLVVLSIIYYASRLIGGH